MPRTCSVCRHSGREAIERALLAGEPHRRIAARFGTSASALLRHRADHLSAGLMKAHDAVETARAETLLDDVRHGENRAERLYNAAEAILGRALEAKDLRTALQAIRAAAAVMAESRQYLRITRRSDWRTRCAPLRSPGAEDPSIGHAENDSEHTGSETHGLHIIS